MDYSKQFVELTKADHDRNAFDCGEQALNQFIKQQALRHMKANISRTMILPSNGNDNGDNGEDEANNSKKLICAFYTLAPSAISRKQLPNELAKKLPQYPIPVFLLAQLAVDKQYHGTGLGKITLIKALEHLYRINAHMRAYAVVVDCLSANAENFYRYFGFKKLVQQEGKVSLYLPMKQLDVLFGGS